MTFAEKAAIVETYLGPIDWIDETRGRCECPGKAKHTTPNGERDCLVYLDRVPTVFCFHSSCEGDVAEYSCPLRQLIPIEENKSFSRSEWKRKTARENEILGVAAETKKRLLAQRFPSASALNNRLSPKLSRDAFFDLFCLSDLLWIGQVTHSGPFGRDHFHSMEFWRKQRYLWPISCAGTFKPDHDGHRSKFNILEQKYYVIEFDHLSLDREKNRLLGLTFFLDLKDTFELDHRLTVDTGGKSPHFWVANNNPEVWNDDLFRFLIALGADKAGLQLAQPVRFPGVFRTETQRPQAVVIL